MSVIDRATAHYAKQERLIIAVPEWGDGDPDDKVSPCLPSLSTVTGKLIAAPIKQKKILLPRKTIAPNM